MLTTTFCRLLNITHPVVLGPMLGRADSRLVTAVSNAGGLGILGCGGSPPEQIEKATEDIRRDTSKPFGLNLLLCMTNEEEIAATLRARPTVLSTSWAEEDQDLAELFARAHQAGIKVMHTVPTVGEAERAAEAGADVIVAQGTEGGGHVGVMSTIVLVPMVARAVAPIPVLASGGLADGAGLASALLLGAEGVMYGTRFLATDEAPGPDSYKRAIVDSNGHNTVLSQLTDHALASVWPGAYSRVLRNRFVESFAYREGSLRYWHKRAATDARRAYQEGDTDWGFLYSGQSAGLINSIEPAATVVERIVADATKLLQERAASLLLAATGNCPGAAS
jgi:NAD(P)H-dependent flavin oxidoreductase YrpB (nitropropane dioxygenase family)